MNERFEIRPSGGVRVLDGEDGEIILEQESPMGDEPDLIQLQPQEALTLARWILSNVEAE